MAVSKTKIELLSWRHQKVYDLLVAGYNQTEIAQILKVSDHTIISRDVAHIRAQAKERIKTHLEERLPMEVDFCLSGVSNITKAALKIAEETSNDKVKLAALALANDSYKYRMEIVSNSTIVTDALRWIESYNAKLSCLPSQPPPLSSPSSSSSSSSDVIVINQQQQQPEEMEKEKEVHDDDGNLHGSSSTEVEFNRKKTLRYQYTVTEPNSGSSNQEKYLTVGKRTSEEIDSHHITYV